MAHSPGDDRFPGRFVRGEDIREAPPFFQKRIMGDSYFLPPMIFLRRFSAQCSIPLAASHTGVLLCISFQRCTAHISNNFHGLDIVNVYGTAQHIEGVIVFNRSLEERIVSQIIHHDKVSAIRHVEYDFLITASRFCIMGCSDSDTGNSHRHHPARKCGRLLPQKRYRAGQGSLDHRPSPCALVVGPADPTLFKKYSKLSY